jgi:hypothetical protein
VDELSAGLGLKAEHYADALAWRPEGAWFEVHAENYEFVGGPRLAWLDAIRRQHPLSLHGVSLSLAGAEPRDDEALAALAALVRRVEPALVSEHLAWSRQGASYLPDLPAFARSAEALATICANVDRVQDTLGWRRHREALPLDDELPWLGESALVARPHDAVAWGAIGAAAAALLAASAHGASFAATVAAAEAAGDAAEVRGWLPALVGAGAFTAIARERG